uniref:protein Hook homolog n=1 Tax=Pristiophorus japonicus TaxID=55135 RepID=UPI00398EE80B
MGGRCLLQSVLYIMCGILLWIVGGETHLNSVYNDGVCCPVSEPQSWLVATGCAADGTDPMCNPLEELQEKVIRLQQENKMLRVQQEEMHKDRLTEFQIVLDAAIRNTHKLENENRNSRINRRTSSTLNFLNYAIFWVKRNGTWSKN